MIMTRTVKIIMTLTAYRKGVTLNDNDKNNNSNDEDRVRGYVYP